MSIVAEQKSQLAKLMATENITVEHRKIQTAGFDTKNRVLYLPIWKNMSGDIYDLLTGHEVGHALYTPSEGWHDAIAPSEKNRNYKNFLNVVEDARIEKKVKRRYPGLKMSFQRAYMELFDRDFFGLRGRDVNDLSFIDRLNIFTKSQYTATHIKFSAVEQLLVKKVETLETWDDVVKLTDEIYEYSKNEQFETYQEQLKLEQDEFDDGDYDDEDYDYDDYEDSFDNYDNSVDSKKSKKSTESDDSDSDSGDSENEKTENKDSEDKDSEDDIGSQTNHFKDSSVSNRDQYNPSCETDENFRYNERQLLDEKCKEFVYVNFPKPILKNIVTPAKIVQQKYTEFYQESIKDGSLVESKMNQWVQEFKNKNERYIGLLAKEFEMRKAAKSFSKSKLSDTGDIDVGKLAAYKFDDNIFRKVMLTPKGKSHGLILLLDKSVSMFDNMDGSIEQILVLAMFCRKVNIPFAVYGFGDSVDVRRIDVGVSQYSPYPHDICFEKRENVIAFSDAYLREYINSDMSNSEFTKALRNMIAIKKSYEGGRWNRQAPRPDTEHLSNTPLTQAIIATAPIMKEFKKKHNLDLTSLVIVHDGDADWHQSSFVKVQRDNYKTGKKEEALVSLSFDFVGKNYVLRDNENKFETRMAHETFRHNGGLNSIALDWFKQTTGSKVFGFFLIPGNKSKWAIRSHYILEDGESLYDKERKANSAALQEEIKKVNKKFEEEKFLLTNHRTGFDSFFLVAGGNDLVTSEDEIEIDGKVTSSKLKNAFMKFSKKKAVNRVLVSKFIQGIAA
jgi:hypothetical protein